MNTHLINRLKPRKQGIYMNITKEIGYEEDIKRVDKP